MVGPDDRTGVLMRNLPLVLPLLLLDLFREPVLHEPHQGHIERILVGEQDDLRPAEGTLALARSLHLDEASDAKEMSATQADRLEGDTSADQTCVVVQARQDAGGQRRAPVCGTSMTGLLTAAACLSGWPVRRAARKCCRSSTSKCCRPCLPSLPAWTAQTRGTQPKPSEPSACRVSSESWELAIMMRSKESATSRPTF